SNVPSDITATLQTDLAGDPVEGSSELPAPGLRGTAELGGDLGPLSSLGAEVGNSQFLGRQPAAQLGEQFSAGGDPAPARLGGGRFVTWHLGPDLASLIAPSRPLPARLVSDLVARNGHEQPDELLGPLELVLTGRGAKEKARQDRLAEVHRIENSPQPRVGQ